MLALRNYSNDAHSRVSDANNNTSVKPIGQLLRAHDSAAMPHTAEIIIAVIVKLNIKINTPSRNGRWEQSV